MIWLRLRRVALYHGFPIRQRLEFKCPRDYGWPADWKSAIQQVGNLRYDTRRLKEETQKRRSASRQARHPAACAPQPGYLGNAQPHRSPMRGAEYNGRDHGGCDKRKQQNQDGRIQAALTLIIRQAGKQELTKTSDHKLSGHRQDAGHRGAQKRMTGGGAAGGPPSERVCCADICASDKVCILIRCRTKGPPFNSDA